MARPKKIVTQTMAMGILTNQDFINVFNQLLQESMPMATAYQLLIIQDELKTHHANFDTLRQQLIARYGETDAAGALMLNEGRTQYKLRDVSEFNREFVELMNLQVPVSKIPLSHLDNLKLSPANLRLLMDSIVRAP